MLKDAQSMFKTLTQTIQNWLDRLWKCQRFKELRKKYHPGMKDFRRGEANPWSLGFLQTWRQQSSARLPQCTSATRHRIRWCDSPTHCIGVTWEAPTAYAFPPHGGPLNSSEFLPSGKWFKLLATYHQPHYSTFSHLLLTLAMGCNYCICKPVSVLLLWHRKRCGRHDFGRPGRLRWWPSDKCFSRWSNGI